MRSIPRLVAGFLAASAAALLPGTPAAAGAEPITGHASVPGYTVLAVGGDGAVATAFAPEGSFALTPPAETVTLHLRAPDGTYAGPVVVEERTDALPLARAAVARAKARLAKARKRVRYVRKRLRNAERREAKRRWTRRLARSRKRRSAAKTALEKAQAALKKAESEAAARPGRAILGVKAGAPLGEVTIGPGYGLARGLKSAAAAAAWVDATRRSRAVAGVPVGAGNFGFVASQPAPGSVPGDLDLDGVPDPLDVDDDGDLLLDNFEQPGAARVAQQRTVYDISMFHIHALALEDTVNANATGITAANVDSALAKYGVLQLGYPTTGETELDCRGLTYCSPGGTGVVAYAGPPGPTPATGEPFPSCCDQDGDGFGTIATPPQSGLFTGDWFLSHGATTAQIATGDVLVEHHTVDGVEAEYATTLQGVIATVPAAVSWSDTAGHGQSLSYPIPPPYVGSPGGPERTRDAFVVSPGPDGDIVLTFTFWRPQRQPIAGEAGDWIDIGRLLYTVTPENLPDEPGGPKFCPQSTLSSSDPNLTPEEIPGFGIVQFPGRSGGFRDKLADAPASGDNVLTMSLNVTDCLALHERTWDPGEEFWITIYASNGFDRAAQGLSFRRE